MQVICRRFDALSWDCFGPIWGPFWSHAAPGNCLRGLLGHPTGPLGLNFTCSGLYGAIWYNFPNNSGPFRETLSAPFGSYFRPHIEGQAHSTPRGVLEPFLVQVGIGRGVPEQVNYGVNSMSPFALQGTSRGRICPHFRRPAASSGRHFRLSQPMVLRATKMGAGPAVRNQIRSKLGWDRQNQSPLQVADARYW